MNSFPRNPSYLPAGLNLEDSHANSPSNNHTLGRDSPSLSLSANNITTRHPKVKTRIHLNNPLCVGGFSIHGQLEVECSTEDKLRLGKIGVEVIGFEEIVDRPNIKRGISTRCNRHIFLVLSTILQSPETGAAPELSMNPPGEDGLWPTRKGKVFLPFTLNLPETIPSVFSNQFSEIRYIIAGSVEVAFHNRKRNLVTHHEATVYEGIELSMELPHLLKFPVVTECQRQIFLGGKGMIKVQCFLQRQIWPAGNEVPVGIRIRNETRRKISAIKLSLVQYFKAYSAKNLSEPVVAYQTTLASQVCKSKSILIGLDNGVERECTLRLQIPSEVRTIRRSRLLDVSYVIKVTLIRTLNSIILELPLLIAHQVSIEPPLYLTLKQEIDCLRPSGDSAFEETTNENFTVPSKKDVLNVEDRSLTSQLFVNPPYTLHPTLLPTLPPNRNKEVRFKTLKDIPNMENVTTKGTKGTEICAFKELRANEDLKQFNAIQSYADSFMGAELESPKSNTNSGTFHVPLLQTRPALASYCESISIRKPGVVKTK